MNRKDLAECVALSLGVTIEDGYKAIDDLFSHIRWALTLRGENSVHLPGIGTLKSTFSEQRKGRNFKTGEQIKIYETKTVKFSISKSLKDEFKVQMRPYLEEEYPDEFKDVPMPKLHHPKNPRG